MNRLRPLWILALILTSLALTGCAVSLAADVTPPPNAESYTASDTQAPVEAIYPIVPPSPENGREIFVEKCAPCHGVSGLGDGPQAGNLPNPPAALGDPNLAWTAKPVRWFTIVTEGNLERYMPGFKSLDDRQRWDVVAYSLSLSMPADQIAIGEQVYEQSCASCHGEAGEGSDRAPNWTTSPDRLANLSTMELASITLSGSGEMPGFEGQLSEQEILASAVYIRSLSFDGSAEQLAAIPTATVSPAGTEIGPVEPEATPEGTPASESSPEPELTEAAIQPASVTVKGEVTNPSGGTLPSGLIVTLEGYDGMEKVLSLETEVQPDGSYRFDNVEMAEDRAFIALVNHNGLSYNSDVYHNQDMAPAAEIDLPITFFETTTDTSVLRTERMHIFFDFSGQDVVQVVELFIITNTGDKVLVAADSTQGVVQFELPEGATNLQFQDSVIGERYIQTDKGFADRQSIAPESGSQILFAYDLPYSRKMNLSIPIPMDVDAAVVMLPQGVVSLKGDQLQSTGSQEVQGMNLDLYTATGLTAGSTLDLTLTGRASGGLSIQTGQTTGLILGGVVLGLALIGVGYWSVSQRKKNSDVEEAEEEVLETREQVMDAIIALEDLYKTGDLPEEAYLKRRSELKERLKVMEQ